jgi:hypothetical protein
MACPKHRGLPFVVTLKPKSDAGDDQIAPDRPQERSPETVLSTEIETRPVVMPFPHEIDRKRSVRRRPEFVLDDQIRRVVHIEVRGARASA